MFTQQILFLIFISSCLFSLLVSTQDMDEATFSSDTKNSSINWDNFTISIVEDNETPSPVEVEELPYFGLVDLSSNTLYLNEYNLSTTSIFKIASIFLITNLIIFCILGLVNRVLQIYRLNAFHHKLYRKSKSMLPEGQYEM